MQQSRPPNKSGASRKMAKLAHWSYSRTEFSQEIQFTPTNSSLLEEKVVLAALLRLLKAQLIPRLSQYLHKYLPSPFAAMLPFLAEIGVVGATLAYFFAAIGGVVLLIAGATIVSIFGTVKDKTSRWAERILGGVLLAVLAAGFLCLLVLIIVLLIL